MEDPPLEAVPPAEEVKAEEAAVPPPAAAAAAGLVLGPRMRKRVVDSEYVHMYDDELYASEDSLSDGAPYRGGKRRAGGGSTPAQRAKQVRPRRGSCALAARRSEPARSSRDGALRARNVANPLC
jgi:hypothetical protein